MRWVRPPNRTILVVLLAISASLIGEYLSQNRQVVIPRGLGDNFPQPLSSWDTSLFLSLNVDQWNPYVGELLNILTVLGSFSATVIACGLLFLSGQNRRGILASASVIAVTACVVVLKVVTARPRPFMVLEGVHLLSVEGDPSFPSGHASRAFSLVHLASEGTKRSRVLWYSVAGLVAFSRVYLGVHYPLDAVGGVALGLLSGMVSSRHERLFVPRVERAMIRLGLAGSKLNTAQ